MISGHVLLLEYTILLRLAARQPQAHTVFHATPHAITTCCAISTYGCDGVPCGLASSDGIISRLPQATECHVASLPPRPAPRSAPQSLLGYGARRACQLTLCQPLLAASRFCARDVLLDVFRQRLRDEFGAEVLFTSPTVPYKVRWKDGNVTTLEALDDWPDAAQLSREVSDILEPVVDIEVVTPREHVGACLEHLETARAQQTGIESTLDGRSIISCAAPWANG